MQLKFCKQNTCVSDNNPFAGKGMGRHINFKRKFQIAFMNKIFAVKNSHRVYQYLGVWFRVYFRVWVRAWFKVWVRVRVWFRVWFRV